MNRHDALLGALVADAASLGLHWLYDQDHIKLIESTGSLLFRQPDAAHYKDTRGYFAHEHRRAGQSTHYGESARIVGELALAGDYTIANHQKNFMASFGPCGSYQGYADKPTKQLIGRMLLEGDDLQNPSGMDDDQMPGVCVVPGLFAGGASASDTLEAAEVISTNSDVSQAAEAVWSVLSQLLSGVEMKVALATSAEAVDGELGERMQAALKMDVYDPLQAGEQFGLACYVKHAMPLSWHLLHHATDFESVLRDNIRCGGDCCGRSMAVGSIAGLAFGVPAELQRKASLVNLMNL